ncbi:MAG: hypothetical protein AB8G05_06085 [Oligoflexales bacterium]
MKFSNSKKLNLYSHTLFLCFITLYSLSCKQTRRLDQNQDQNPQYSENIEENSRPQTHLSIKILDPQKTSILKLTAQEEAEHLLNESNYQFKLNVIVDDSDSAEETTIYLKSFPVYGLDEQSFSLGATKISPLPSKISKAGKPPLESPRIKNFRIEHDREIFAPSSVARDHMFPSTQTKQDYELGGEVIGKLEDGSLIKIKSIL